MHYTCSYGARQTVMLHEHELGAGTGSYLSALPATAAPPSPGGSGRPPDDTRSLAPSPLLGDSSGGGILICKHP